MPTLRQLPLTQKLVAMSTITSLIALLIAGSVWVVDSWFSGHEALRDEIHTIADLIADRSNAALAFDDAQLAEQNLNTLKNLRSVQVACIYSDSGALFASYAAVENENCPVTDSIAANLTDTRSIDVHIPIKLDERTIGNLYIRSDLRRVQTRLQHALLITLLVFFVAGLVAYIISSRLQHLISAPIAQLASTAQQITKEHNYSVRAIKQSDDELGQMVDSFNDMLDTIEDQNRHLTNARDELEHLVSKRTAELQSSNRELEAFCYSVSHDLRAPLRSIHGFSQALMDDYEDLLDEDGKDHLQRVMRSANRMGTLIDDLLNLSRVSRCDLKPQPVDMSQVAKEITDEHLAESDHKVSIDIQPDIQGYGDPVLIRVVLDNLIGNAIKYSSNIENAHISFGQDTQDDSPAFWVKDNGVGFDMQYAGKLFGAFQRLHRADEFEGTGVGLATVARVVHRHGGKIWAEAEVDNGACFYFTLAPTAT